MRRQRHSSDLTCKQFKRLEALLPVSKAGGRLRTIDMYEAMCAIFYVLKNGCAWRDLPHDFPAWQTVYGYFQRFQQDGTWEAVNRFPLRRTRINAGRNPEPSAGSIDAQTVRCTPQAGIRGIDAGKKTNGRKRHIAVDTLALLAQRFPRLQHIWADGGYTGSPVSWAKEVLD